MDDIIKNTNELSKIKKENPFAVPDNYFDNFSARLQTKIAAEKATVPKPTTRIIQFLKPVISLAASFAIIFLLVYWPLKTFGPKEMANAEINSDWSDNEFLNVIENLDENSFYALLDEDADEMKFSDDDLVAYVSANFSDYEIYMNTEN